MPAKGWQYLEIEAFPLLEIGSNIKTIYQGSLAMDWVDEGPTTVVTALGLADHRDFSKYHVMHETYQKLHGRYRNQPISGYIAQIEFHLFHHVSSKRMFIDTRHEYSREMIERLEQSDSNISVKLRNIDLSRLASDLRASVRGGWFGELKVADVSTIGIFGPTVGESDEWVRYEQVGKLKALDLQLQTEYRNLPLKIMSNRGIVLYEMLSELESLQLLLDLQKALDGYHIDV